jgi:O-antigen ligase
MPEEKRKRRRHRHRAKVSDGPGPNRTIFVLLFLIPCLTTIAYGGTETWALIILSPLIAALGLIWIVRSWRAGEFSINFDSLLLPLLGLLLLALFQLLPFGNAGVPPDALGIPASNALSMDPYSTRLFVARLAGYIAFFAAALTFINTEGRVRKLVGAVAIFGGTMAFLGILQKLASPDAIYGFRTTPQAIPFGPFVNQHHFASLMVLLSGPTLAHIFGNAATRQKKLLLGIAAVIMAIAVVLTGSRGGLISYFAMLGIASLAMFWRGSEEPEKKSWLPAVAGSIAVLVIAVGAVVFLGGAESLLRGIGFQNTSDDLSSGRLHFWSVALRIFFANPVFGAGFDAFGTAFTEFDTRNGLFRVEQAHNDYLQTLADGGVIGFACIVAFIVLFVKRSFTLISSNLDSFQRVTVLGAFAGCVGIMIHSFFDFPLRTAANAFFFLLIAAIAAAPVSVSVSKGRLSNTN